MVLNFFILHLFIKWKAASGLISYYLHAFIKGTLVYILIFAIVRRDSLVKMLLAHFFLPMKQNKQMEGHFRNRTKTVLKYIQCRYNIPKLHLSG